LAFGGVNYDLIELLTPHVRSRNDGFVRKSPVMASAQNMRANALGGDVANGDFGRDSVQKRVDLRFVRQALVKDQEIDVLGQVIGEERNVLDVLDAEALLLVLTFRLGEKVPAQCDPSDLEALALHLLCDGQCTNSLATPRRALDKDGHQTVVVGLDGLIDDPLLVGSLFEHRQGLSIPLYRW
jgi:hypothetical protein